MWTKLRRLLRNDRGRLEQQAGYLLRQGTAVLALLATAAPAWAQDEDQDQADADAEEGTEAETKPDTGLPRLGQAPGEPQVRSAPPAIPFGVPPSKSYENVLDFHGYLLVPLRASVLQRDDPGPAQHKTALHSPPLIPQRLRGFEYTGVVPGPYVQLDFAYGNEVVSGTAIISSRAVTDGVAIYNPVEQLGVNDAFIGVNLTKTMKTPFLMRLGAFTNRYGVMGAYDAGRYGTPLIARVNAVGENLEVGAKLGEKATLVVEQGIAGQLGRPPEGMLPAGWNDFADPNVGASFVSHIHGGLNVADTFQLGLHYLSAFTQDDRVGDGSVPDGRITVLGADARLTAGRAGHLYVGGARTIATNAAYVSGVIEILNARGGPELMEEYLGENSQGDGALTTFGAQYDLSLSRLIYGDYFRGDSPDLIMSLFGIGTKVKSDDPEADGTLKIKGGAEATYNVASWFGVSGRYDHVRLDATENRQAFSIQTARLLFHTDWQSRDEFALQYSHFDYGSQVYVYTGYPPEEDREAKPDQHVFVLSGTFWW